MFFKNLWFNFYNTVVKLRNIDDYVTKFIDNDNY